MLALLVTIVALTLRTQAPSAATPGQSPVARAPSFAYAEASGCDGLLVYTWNEPRTEVLTIRVDRAVVPLRNGTTTFRLENETAHVQVRAEMTEEERSNMQFCSDAGTRSRDKPVAWLAKAGTLKVTMAPRPGVPFISVSISLEDLVLRSPDGSEVRSRRDIKFTAAVALAGQ